MRWRRPRKDTTEPIWPFGVCWHCEYPLAEVDGEVCPECGTPVAWSRGGFRLTALGPTDRLKAWRTAQDLSLGPLWMAASVAVLVFINALSDANGFALLIARWLAVGPAVLGTFCSVRGLWRADCLAAGVPAGVPKPTGSRVASVAFAAALAASVAVAWLAPANPPFLMQSFYMGFTIAALAVSGWVMFHMIDFAGRRRRMPSRRRTKLYWSLGLSGLLMVGFGSVLEQLGIEPPGWTVSIALALWLITLFMPLVYAGIAREIAIELRRAGDYERA